MHHSPTTARPTGCFAWHWWFFRLGMVALLYFGATGASMAQSTAAPVVWLRADLLTNFTNGAPLADWPDVSGNNMDAAQAVSRQQPVYATNAINGWPAIHFIAANQSTLTLNRPVQNDFTIFCVFRSSQGLNAGAHFREGAGLVSGAVSSGADDFGAGLFADGQVAVGTGNPDASVESLPGSNDNLPHLFVFTRTQSAGEISLCMDGANLGMTLGNVAPLISPSQLALGAQPGGSNYYDGYLAEIQIYTNALSDAQRQVVEIALGTKYAITPPAPTQLTVLNSNGWPTLNWTGSSLAAGYHVKRATNVTGPFLTVGTSTNQNFQDGSATPGHFYYYEISSLSGSGLESSNSTAASPAVLGYSLNSGPSVLNLCSNAGQWCVTVQLTNGIATYLQTQPLAVEVVADTGTESWLSAPYASVQSLSNNQLRGAGTITSPNGSVFDFTDVWQKYDDQGAFLVDRSVLVSNAGAGDAGFSTKLTLQRSVAGAMADYDFFLPAVWYKDNTNVNAFALANTPTDNLYWCREDRLPLPLFMLRDKGNGATLTVAHQNPDGSTFAGEDYQPRIIDSRLNFASLGMENNTQPAAGLLFPGSEGERTLIGGGSAQKGWALRAHPVTTGFAQHYRLTVRLTVEPDFPTALKDTWNATGQQFQPASYDCNLNEIYSNGISALNRYWTNLNNAAGEPFRVPWPTGIVTNVLDYNYQMGFVGMQLPNAAILIREGFNTTNLTLRSRGEQMAQWWAANCLTPTGCPKTWYDPLPQTWRSYPTYVRVACDGMLGLLWAWNQENLHSLNHSNWLAACTHFGDWLLDHQHSDGSIERSFDYTTDLPVETARNNTSHIVRYLAELYLATGDTRYQTAAIAAGNYIYTDVFQNFNYVGGTPDNPDVPDKEAASMALRAFTALYDLTRDPRWLAAATQTANYYATWIYGWNVPLPANDPGLDYPANRKTTGLSAIATANGGCDSYAATDAFETYRLYLYTGDTNLLNLAREMLYLTKQPLDWDAANPLPGYGDPGIFAESLTLVTPRGHGVAYYLPWQTANYLEPMVNLQDTFGSWDLAALEQTPLALREAQNHAFALHRNYATTQPVSAAPASLSATNDGSGIALTWNSASSAVYYNLKRATNSGGPYTLIASQANTSFVDTNVANLAAYYYVVSALSPGGESSNSVEVAAVARLSPPLTASLPSDRTQLNLSWPAWATNFALYETTNLVLPINWQLVGSPAHLSNGNFFQTIPATSQWQHYFRLATLPGS